MNAEITDRVITPVVGKALAGEDAVGQELGNRHQLDGCDTELL